VTRYIYCYPCGAQALDRIENQPHEAGVGHMTMGGQARHEFRCDWCNVVLLVGDLALAVTRHTGDYHPWELRYLQPLLSTGGGNV
jgi:hypothetical protein